MTFTGPIRPMPTAPRVRPVTRASRDQQRCIHGLLPNQCAVCSPPAGPRLTGRYASGSRGSSFGLIDTRPVYRGII
jgi:hypothetical protein